MLGSYCDLDGIRTHDSLIKSQVLYQLSYEIMFLKSLFSKTAAKISSWNAKKQTSPKKNPHNIWKQPF